MLGFVSLVLQFILNPIENDCIYEINFIYRSILRFKCESYDSILLGQFGQGRETKEKYHLANWANVCKPKKEGALGFKSLRQVNMALLESCYGGSVSGSLF